MLRLIRKLDMRIATTVACIATSAVVSLAWAQTSIAPPTGQKTLAATLNVYAFPGAGQSSEQQSKDETECYNWAVSTTGTDPFQASKQAAQQQQQAARQMQQASQAGQGAAARGAVGGAATGALIGAIAGNAGKGAAIGAGVGLLGGGARAQGRQQQAAQQGAQQTQAAQQALAAQMDTFKKAFSACLEAHKYTVKY